MDEYGRQVTCSHMNLHMGSASRTEAFYLNVAGISSPVPVLSIEDENVTFSLFFKGMDQVEGLIATLQEHFITRSES